MKMSNNEIYSYAMKMIEAFTDNTQRLPVKVNFYLQKNKSTLVSLAQDIEKARMEIVQTYGVLNPDGAGQFIIPADKVEAAQKELADLLALEQEVNIYKVNIDNFPEDLILTAGQMDAIMFMIE